MRRVSELVALGAFAVVLLLSPLARAEPKGVVVVEDENTKNARAEFVTGADHVKNARWGEALASFERSAALRPHALTTYNIAACERALGRYTRARATLKRALDADQASGNKDLPKSFADDAKRWQIELDSLVVRVSVTLAPADATILVDGAALVKEGDHLVAGFSTGESVKAPGTQFTMQIDPGDHLFALTRAGFANAIVQKHFDPGTSPKLKLDLQSLPAEIKVSANVKGAVVSVDDLDSGIAPVQLTRPAGVYHVEVRKLGFLPYETTVKVNAGEQPSLVATLSPETTPVYKTWWFWSAAAVVVAGAAVGTYFLTRPDPERPAPNGGGLGWVVSVPASR